LINNFPKANGTAWSFHSSHLPGHTRELPPFATSHLWMFNPVLTAANLASSGAGDVEALVALLATSKADTRPLPAGAGALTTENVHRDGLGANAALDAVDSQASNRDTGGRLAGRRAVLVVLLDHDSVLGNVLKGDVLVGHVLDGAGRAGDGLDADTVVGVDDLGVKDLYGVNDVVIATADGADRETVATGAVSTGEGDVGTAVHGEAVVLVVNGSAGDGDVLRITDIESVGVVAALGVTILVVDGNAADSQGIGVVDGEHLNGGVLDRNALDDGVGHLVGVEKLGLGLSTVGALGVPPAGSVSVKSGAGAIDSDVVAGDRDERSLPLLVTESGGALENDVGALGQVGQVEGGAGGDNKIAEGDGRARLLVLDGVGSAAGTREGTAVGASIKRCRSGDDRRGSQCHGGEGSEEMHSEK
jgi:hypothetical protein